MRLSSTVGLQYCVVDVQPDDPLDGSSLF